MFALSISEMGLKSFDIFLILFLSAFFIVSFVLSSKNMDFQGLEKWLKNEPNVDDR